MERGYVNLWRKTLESGLLQNANLWTFWSWCLLKAAWKERNMVINMQHVKIFPGQFIFGRKSASNELKMSEQTIRTCVEKLKNMENLTIKSTSHYSVITIVNWDTYQSFQPANNHLSNQPPTSRQPAANHKQECNKGNKDKAEKETPPFVYPEKYSDILKSKFNDFIRNRTELKKPVTEIAFNSLVNKLEKLSGGNENIAIDILENSIENGWAGIFELKKGKTKTITQNSLPEWM